MLWHRFSNSSLCKRDLSAAFHCHLLSSFCHKVRKLNSEVLRRQPSHLRLSQRQQLRQAPPKQLSQILQFIKQDRVLTAAISVSCRCTKLTSQETSVDSRNITMNLTVRLSIRTSSASVLVEINFLVDFLEVNLRTNNLTSLRPTSSSQLPSPRSKTSRITSNLCPACARLPSKSLRPFPKSAPTRFRCWTRPLSQRTYRSRSNLRPPMSTKMRENRSEFEERKSYSNVKRWRIYLNVLNKCPRTFNAIKNALLSHWLKWKFQKYLSKNWTNDVVEKLIQKMFLSQEICFVAGQLGLPE